MSYAWRERKGSFSSIIGLVVLGVTAIPVVARAQSTSPSAAAQPAAIAAAVAPATAVADAAIGPAGGSGAAQARGTTDSAHDGSPSIAATGVLADKSVIKGPDGVGIVAAAQKLNPLMIRALKQFEVAKTSFTGFCQDWHRKLAQREVDNLAHIVWKLQNGLETGSYVGYGPIESCTCKQASNGVPIGELTYKELDTKLTGKTVDDARHAKPSVTAVPTREIFSWDKGKWFY